MSQRSSARARRAHLWIAGVLLALTVVSAAPGQAAEPDRQEKLPVSARLSPGKTFSLIVRGDDRGERGGRQNLTLSRTAFRIDQLPWHAGLPGADLPQAQEYPAGAEVALLEMPAIPGAMSGVDVGRALRTPLRALSQWARVMAAAEPQISAMTRCNPEQDNCPAEVLHWQELLQEARGLPPFEQLKTVNAFVNRWPYRHDIDVYGANEYWATPQEFLQQSGDCEDYCITKYFALKQLGVPPERMNIVLLIDTLDNIPHAVLAVRYGQESYVLDNRSDLLLPYQNYAHLQPVYSLNEHYRWAYLATSLRR